MKEENFLLILKKLREQGSLDLLYWNPAYFSCNILVNWKPNDCDWLNPRFEKHFTKDKSAKLIVSLDFKEVCIASHTNAYYATIPSTLIIEKIPFDIFVNGCYDSALELLRHNFVVLNITEIDKRIMNIRKHMSSDYADSKIKELGIK